MEHPYTLVRHIPTSVGFLTLFSKVEIVKWCISHCLKLNATDKFGHEALPGEYVIRRCGEGRCLV